MTAGMTKLIAIVVGLLFLVPDTMQLSIYHPLHAVVERLNVNAEPFLGLIVSSSGYETELKKSKYFEADTSIPYITIAGRTFKFGKFNGEPVIYVLAGEPLANVGVTVQILIDTFHIKGIINFGSAATVSDGVSIANVVVPSQVAFTGVLRWEKYDSEVKTPSLVIGDYNVPKAGDNYLEHITSLKTKATSTSKRTYFFDVHSEWLQLASQLNFDDRSFVVHLGEDYRVGSSDFYVKNDAYATFLNKKLNITAIDTQSAAVVATAVANGVPHIVFRGTSNRPGTDLDSELFELLTKRNVLKTVAVFIKSLSSKTNANVY